MCCGPRSASRHATAICRLQLSIEKPLPVSCSTTSAHRIHTAFSNRNLVRAGRSFNMLDHRCRAGDMRLPHEVELRRTTQVVALQHIYVAAPALCWPLFRTAPSPLSTSHLRTKALPGTSSRTSERRPGDCSLLERTSDTKAIKSL